MKLAQGLGDQLVWQHNRDDSIQCCSGLYFPTFSRGQYVVQIQLEWKDSNLQFAVTKRFISMTTLQECVSSLIQAELAKVPLLASYDNTGTARSHKIPLTQAFVVTTLGWPFRLHWENRLL